MELGSFLMARGALPPAAAGLWGAPGAPRLNNGPKGVAWRGVARPNVFGSLTHVLPSDRTCFTVRGVAWRSLWKAPYSRAAPVLPGRASGSRPRPRPDPEVRLHIVSAPPRPAITRGQPKGQQRTKFSGAIGKAPCPALPWSRSCSSEIWYGRGGRPAGGP